MPAAHSRHESSAAAAAWRDSTHMDHRFGRRFRCGTTVDVSCDGATAQGRLLDVSLSGAYLQTPLALPLFAVIDVASSAGGRATELGAWVVRRDAGGVGIEWCDTPGRSICRVFGCTRTCDAL